MASSDSEQDPVAAAIRSAAAHNAAGNPPQLLRFVPFDPATKMSEATASDPHLGTLRIIKGAFALVGALAASSLSVQPYAWA